MVQHIPRGSSEAAGQAMTVARTLVAFHGAVDANHRDFSHKSGWTFRRVRVLAYQIWMRHHGTIGQREAAGEASQLAVAAHKELTKVTG